MLYDDVRVGRVRLRGSPGQASACAGRSHDARPTRAVLRKHLPSLVHSLLSASGPRELSLSLSGKTVACRPWSVDPALPAPPPSPPSPIAQTNSDTLPDT